MHITRTTIRFLTNNLKYKIVNIHGGKCHFALFLCFSYWNNNKYKTECYEQEGVVEMFLIS